MVEFISNQKQTLQALENIELPLPLTLSDYNNQTFTVGL